MTEKNNGGHGTTLRFFETNDDSKTCNMHLTELVQIHDIRRMVQRHLCDRTYCVTYACV